LQNGRDDHAIARVLQALHNDGESASEVYGLILRTFRDRDRSHTARHSVARMVFQKGAALDRVRCAVYLAKKWITNSAAHDSRS
jgi:hypothetical protein